MAEGNASQPGGPKGPADSQMKNMTSQCETQVAEYVRLLCSLVGVGVISAICASALFGFSPLCVGFHVVKNHRCACEECVT